MQSFTERMEQAKAIAQDQRNRGQSTGVHKSWQVQKILPSRLDAIEAYYNQFRRDVHYWGLIAVEEALFATELEDIRQWL
jgi:hypothetical protein